jgi:transposase-like protein
MYSERELKRKQIQLLCDQGLPDSEVAKQVGVDHKTVKKWKNTNDFKHKYNTIQKKKLTPNTKRRISGLMMNRTGASLRKCSKRLNFSNDYKSRNKTISHTAVQNYLKTTEWGRVARKLRPKPLLSKKNIKDRLTFALNVQMEGYCDQSQNGRSFRENILFTDESPIELNSKPNPQNTRIRTSDKTKATVGIPKFPLKIMVAGGITANGVTDLYVCPKGETINGQVYEEKILPIYLSAINNRALIRNKRKATFQQDSAPGHKIRSVIDKIESTFPNSWTEGVWSGNSPDFNVIEHVWSVLQDSVFETPIPRTREELIQRVRQKWFSLTREYLSSLVHSFPKRIEQAINNEGGHTDY